MEIYDVNIYFITQNKVLRHFSIFLETEMKGLMISNYIKMYFQTIY